MDSEEESFYCSSGDGDDQEPYSNTYYSSGDDDDQERYSNTKKDYTILNEETIRQLQENDISEISSVLSVSRSLACSLLLRDNWNRNTVVDKSFANEEGVCEAVEMSTKRKPMELQNQCKICLETVNTESMLSAACGHPFCAGCWKNYFTAAINDGPGCLTLLCPEPKCKAIVGLDMVESLVSYDVRHKYNQYLYRSYIERNRNRKWCPAPGCEFAVEFAPGGCESYDVTCDCSYKFCWNCTEESHRPVNCATVAEWIKKNSSEAENTTWIMAYTKSCPNCHRNIEKNHGCNHMTCAAPCRHEFCWFCLEPWTPTSYEDHKCNRYNDEEENAIDDSLDAARNYLDRYAHYYERWASNHKSRDIALADLDRVRKEHIPLLSQVQAETDAFFQFLIEAWEQIIECRRVLKWTYAYAYYINAEKKTFFEYLQGQAEAALERLHHCAEKEMEKYIKAKCKLDDFMVFHAKLIDLTTITRNHFQNLVRALENDLSEVESIVSTEACSSTQAHMIEGKR